MHAIVVGASIGGLAATLALERLGIEVDVLERIPGMPVDRGAGLAINLPLLRKTLGKAADTMPVLELAGRQLHLAERVRGQAPRLLGSRREETPHPVSTWQHLHSALRRQVRGPVHQGVTVRQVTALSENVAECQDTTGKLYSGELLIGADGHRSIVRSAVCGSTAPEYAGYLLWRGFVDEVALAPRLRELFLDRHLHLLALHPYHFVAYEVPGPAGGAPRRLNWGWYASVSDAACSALLARAGLAEGTMVVAPRELCAADRDEWVALAQSVWPEPWAELVAQTAGAGAMFANVICELAPERLWKGVAALVGDAAHLMSPITGSGARMALADALALETSLAAMRPGESVPAALSAYSDARAPLGIRAVASGHAWASEALGTGAQSRN